jgi:hypothetical protein
MKKLIQSFLLSVLLMQTGCAEWIFFGESPKATLYIDLKKIERGSDTSKLWVKYVFSEEAKKLFQANTGTSPLFSEEYIEVSRNRRSRSHLLRLHNKVGIFYTRDKVQAWSPIEQEKHLEPVWKLLYAQNAK